jgi:hypothetical protein
MSVRVQVGDDEFAQARLSTVRPDGRTSARNPATAWCSSMPSPSTVASVLRALAAASMRGFERHIDDVGDDGVVGQGGWVGGQALIAMHAKRCGVDQQRRIAKQLRGCRLRMRTDAIAELVGKFHRTCNSAVDDADVGETALLERVDDRPRSATGAQDHGDVASRSPTRRKMVEIGGKSIGICIAAPQHPVLQPHGVDRTNLLGGLIAALDRSESSFLVRDGDVATTQPSRGKAADEGSEIPGRNIDSGVAAVNVVTLQPMTVDFGERECAIGWPQTNAFNSAIDGPELAQFLEYRQQRQADDGEVVALDLVEQLDTFAFDLVGADARQRLLADTGEMAAMKAGSSARMVSEAIAT